MTHFAKCVTTLSKRGGIAGQGLSPIHANTGRAEMPGTDVLRYAGQRPGASDTTLGKYRPLQAQKATHFAKCVTLVRGEAGAHRGRETKAPPAKPEPFDFTAKERKWGQRVSALSHNPKVLTIRWQPEKSASLWNSRSFAASNFRLLNRSGQGPHTTLGKYPV